MIDFQSRCRRCSRFLKNPESIIQGFGPVCLKKERQQARSSNYPKLLKDDDFNAGKSGDTKFPKSSKLDP